MNILELLKLKKRNTVIAVVSLIIIAAVIFIISIGSGSPTIATFFAKNGEFIIDVETTGEIQAKNSVSVSVPARVWGQLRITTVVEDGTMVKEGDFLVQFDKSEMERGLKDRQNNLDNVKADLISQKANIESQMKELDNSLLTTGYSFEQAKLQFELMKYEAEYKRREQELNFKKSELQLQQAKEKIESQKIINAANLSKAELRVKQYELQVEDAEEQLESLTLNAPKSGMVVLQKIWSPNGRAKVKVGDTPYRGMALITIPDLSVMLVKTYVNEIDISRTAKGQQVIITIDAIPDTTFYGKITSVATLARSEEGSDMKVFDVEITIEGSNDRLKPGMTAECQIITDTIPSVLYIPLEAVFEKEDTTMVYVKKRGFDERPVIIGDKNSDYIIIKDGLAEGEEVALRDPTLPLEELGVEGSDKGGNNSKSNALSM